MLIQFFSIAKTQFLKRCSIPENLKHKTSSSSTIYKTSCKMKHSPQNSFTCVPNQTLLSNHNKVIKMIYTLKQSVNNTPKNRKHIVQNIQFSGRSTFLIKKKIHIFPSLSFDGRKHVLSQQLKIDQKLLLCVALCNFVFVLPPPCTPIFTALYPASHKLVLCLCDTVILVLCLCDSVILVLCLCDTVILVLC